MNFSTTRLASKADCDTLLAMATKEKSAMDFKKLSLQRTYQSFLERSSQLTTDMQVASSEIQALQSVIVTLPEGTVKDDNVSRVKKLEYRLFLLQEQSENYGVVALLEKEMEISSIEKQLEEIDAFRVAIETRKAALS